MIGLGEFSCSTFCFLSLSPLVPSSTQREGARGKCPWKHCRELAPPALPGTDRRSQPSNACRSDPCPAQDEHLASVPCPPSSSGRTVPREELRSPPAPACEPPPRVTPWATGDRAMAASGKVCVPKMRPTRFYSFWRKK